MKNKKLPSLINLLILTVICTVFWVSFNIYRVFTNEPSPAVSEEILLPIDPTLDIQTLNVIKEKIHP